MQALSPQWWYLFAAVCAWLVTPGLTLAFDQLFMVNGRSIAYANIGGTGLSQIAPYEADFDPIGIVYNPLDERVYWSRHYEGIRHADLAGNVEDFLVSRGIFDPDAPEHPINDPHGMAFDVETGHLYWSEGYTGEGIGGRILRAQYEDPSSWEVVIRDIPAWVNSVALDSKAQKLYWMEDCERCPGAIRRADYDGNNIETLVPEIVSPGVIALDLAGQKIYWTARSHPQPGDYDDSREVSQGDLDLVLLNWGADATPPPPGWQINLPSVRIDQWELDAVLENWGRKGPAMYRANLDGTEVETVISGLAIGHGFAGSRGGLAIDSELGHVYWSEPRTIRRANLDGSGIVDVLTDELFFGVIALGTIANVPVSADAHALAIPEPSTVALSAMLFVGLLAWQWRRAR